MVTAYGSRGQNCTLYGESALGTQTTEIGEIRYNEMTIKDEEKQFLAQPNTGHANWADMSDRPIRYNAHMPDAITFVTELRAGSSRTVKPPIIEFLESAGCYYTTNTADTIGTGGTGSFTLTTGNAAIGQVIGVKLPNRVYYPCLVGNYVSGTKTVTPSMDLPETPSNGSVVWQVHTVYPYNRAVTATDTLQIVKHTRGYHSSAPDLAITAAGVALSKLDPIVIESAKPVKIKGSMHATSVSYSASALPADGYVDSEKYQVVGGYFEVGAADTSLSGTMGITHSTMDVIKAEIDLSIATIPIPGEGSTTSVNGIQGYWQQCGTPKVTLTILHANQNLFDVWNESIAETPVYIHFVQPSSNQSNPAWGLYLPCCYLSEPPTVTYENDYIVSVSKYEATSPRLNAATEANNSASTVPWIFGIGLPYEA